MLTVSLGSKNKEIRDNSWTKSKIPDYNKISYAYAETILKAYKLGLVKGMDSDGTFGPDGIFTRAQICTILYRAGYTEAAIVPDTTIATAGPSTEEIFAEIKSWGNWREFGPTIIATDPVYGRIDLYINDNGVIGITMPQKNTSAWIDSKGDLVDAYGNVVPEKYYPTDYCDENGKYIMSSGWSYEGRQLVKKMLEVAFPTCADEAYQALLDVMGQKIWEIPSRSLPSALRWMDGRCFEIHSDEDESNDMISIYICPAGETKWYDLTLSDAAISTKRKMPGAYWIPEMFELDRG